jgi:Holliday junction resolvase RusA-like endonuclease
MSTTSGRLICAVWVPGHPKTKGSMEHIGHGQMRESVDNKGWRALVTKMVAADILERHAAAWKDWAHHTMDAPIGTEAPGQVTRQPVQVGITFWLDHPDPCGAEERAGDVDKLQRLILDALKDAGAYLDDNQVQRVTNPTKFSSRGIPGNAGALIVVQEVTEAEAASWEFQAVHVRRMIVGVR